MAICKRCKAPFNYEKREGICPKCCFYNRPAGTWHEDESWINNYNIENRYVAPVMSNKESETSGGFFKMPHHESKEMSGSDKHLDNGKVVRGSSAVSQKTKQRPAAKKKKSGCLSIVIVLFWIFVIMSFLGFFL